MGFPIYVDDERVNTVEAIWSKSKNEVTLPLTLALTRALTLALTLAIALALTLTLAQT